MEGLQWLFVQLFPKLKFFVIEIFRYREFFNLWKSQFLEEIRYALSLFIRFQKLHDDTANCQQQREQAFSCLTYIFFLVLLSICYLILFCFYTTSLVARIFVPGDSFALHTHRVIRFFSFVWFVFYIFAFRICFLSFCFFNHLY